MRNISDRYFQISPLEFLLLLILAVLVYIVTSLKNNNPEQLSQQNSNSNKQNLLKRENFKQTHKQNSSSNKSINSNGNICRYYNENQYEFFNIDFKESQVQSIEQNLIFKIQKQHVTKSYKDGEWTKLFDPQIFLPPTGKYYFRIIVVKNEYFVKKQANFNNQLTPNIRRGGNNVQVTISRSDIVLGFLIPNLKLEDFNNKYKQYAQNSMLKGQIQNIIKQSEKQFNTVKGIIAYGFNGRIYSNGQLRTEQKVIKKNRIFTILVNQDEGYVQWLCDQQVCGYCLLDKNQQIMIPFIQMFAEGTSIIITS